ncbi:superoxide dismutase family protein [Streptosporangium sp. NBC_01755]|uniref:superoxide dismutase family protein n=1 Tax=unclassified Streptosporangium TaxID=2632669 RepID=UPI002DD85508|nr:MULTISPECIES: superoxide dismutase family protein [unclassified Streptosporangium]WSA26860.1 superoxide dismutase family protein [Streptosporangium sp. NBC_01810]WSD01715.1 superoxide dismutase family protein [Streptosporangium sp. NBC_01755]
MRILGVLAVALLCAGCAERAADPHPAGHGPAATPSASGIRLVGGGVFSAPGPRASTIAYDTALVPPGAAARVTAESGAVLATSTVTVTGMLPGRTYGVHLHVNPCGLKPEDAGPHYQHTHTHASAKNEVWLDFTTDARGEARATATRDWAFVAGRLPRSLVIHAEPTRTVGTEAGSAGPRVACVTLTEP